MSNGRQMTPIGPVVWYHVTGTLIARNTSPSGLVETDVQVDAIVPSYPKGIRYAVAQVAQRACATDDHYDAGADLRVEPVDAPL